jgi:hypothetical protein
MPLILPTQAQPSDDSNIGALQGLTWSAVGVVQEAAG